MPEQRTQPVRLQRSRGIIFSAPMVRAILDGTKTQTRRVVNPQPAPGDSFEFIKGELWCNESYQDGPFCRSLIPCPYGEVGATLWVRETWQPFFKNGFIYLADAGTPRLNAHNEEHARQSWPKWKSARHMPRTASRIALEITAIRVERLQDISEADVIAEGVQSIEVGISKLNGKPADGMIFDPRQKFIAIWEHLNRKTHPWKSSPWVWVITFKRLEVSHAS